MKFSLPTKIHPLLRKFAIGWVHFIQLFLVALYLIIWFTFGLLYQRTANSSHGSDFIFQEDLKTSSQIAAFKQAYHLSVSDDLVHTLIKNKEFDRFALNIQLEPNLPLYQISNKPIGDSWAFFYKELLESEGITHYSLKIEDRVKHPLFGISRVIEGVNELENITSDCFRVKLSLYRGRKDLVPTTAEQVKGYVLVKEHTLWLDFEPHTFLVDEKPIDLIPIDLLPRVLSHSINFLDDSLDHLKEVTRGVYTYPLTDFLYFSAVTITTTGYGDILPGTTYVRVLVMLESLLGVVVIGAFVSSLFLKKNN